ncbi:MAG: ribosome small subunit-dependent GTPase A [bacterium]
MLHTYGWNDERAREFAAGDHADLAPARVSREDRGRYQLLTAAGERTGEVSGRLRHEARSRLDFPAVGDWVAVRAETDGPCIVERVLSRKSVFLREAAGEATEEQVVAANVDTVFLVSGLDDDFNPRRVERYVTATYESGATPVIVLNKADLAADPEAFVAEIETAAPGIDVVIVSAREGTGVDVLARWLAPGRTVALLGSSGVGKSTLANALLGEERQATGGVRESDSKGRHTTTSRELLPLPGGAVLLDTPGMRSLKLWADEDTLASVFPDIEEFAARCRFRDCGHETEPGCAVLAADADGRLAAGRLESWRKLQRELRWLARKQDVRLQREEQGRWKSVTKEYRKKKKDREW